MVAQARFSSLSSVLNRLLELEVGDQRGAILHGEDNLMAGADFLGSLPVEDELSGGSVISKNRAACRRECFNRVFRASGAGNDVRIEGLDVGYIGQLC
jgi:hypothetical protein